MRGCTAPLAPPAVIGPSLVPGGAEGRFRVLTSAGPGSYPVSGTCADGRQIGGVLKVPDVWIG